MGKGHKINALEAFALSLASMAPTGSMAGNTGPSAKFAGMNLPISFLIAAIAMLLVAVGFYEMSKRISADGSVYAYNRTVLNEHWGFISGWLITLCYGVFTIGMSGLSGTYASLVLKNFGIKASPIWIGFIILLLTWFILDHGIRLTSNLPLFTEFIALAILLILSFIIIIKGGPTGTNIQPFIPRTKFSGIGQGAVYTVLCFIGFEVACTVATRTKNPKRSIPIALMSTVIGGAVIFVFVSYAIVIGFGTDASGMKALASSPAPLNTLAAHFMNPGMATLIDFAIFLSAFGAVIGMMNATSYMVYALGEHHYLPSRLGEFSFQHDAPCHSINALGILGVILYLGSTLPLGVNNTYLYYMTIGALSMIIVYMLSCVATLRLSITTHETTFKRALSPILGFIVLILVLLSNVYPIPKFPLNLIPYFVLLWAIIGYAMSVHHTRANNQ
ncbi:APC family permease [Acetilactobacillus jinshanensis]|uniref:APC family permease n=1 Tax=Acetilactobacillus jinshanensis TaxID=1720083 RepID=A0A4P6ZMT6_9LACO|nr:APC family permease [Acetilactobacillus jinshanensis]QBP18943.1 APC family permease [Acetilactobacillus jinshanensis]URL60507.1 APC family permease [uncultured bacterium]